MTRPEIEDRSPSELSGDLIMKPLLPGIPLKRDILARVGLSKVRDLDIPSPFKLKLKSMGVLTIEDLLSRPVEDIMAVGKFGPDTAYELGGFFQDTFGLSKEDENGERTDPVIEFFFDRIKNNVSVARQAHITSPKAWREHKEAERKKQEEAMRERMENVVKPLVEEALGRGLSHPEDVHAWMREKNPRISKSPNERALIEQALLENE